MDYFLRASSEQALTAALESAGIVTVEDDGHWVAPGYALDVIGVIYRPGSWLAIVSEGGKPTPRFFQSKDEIDALAASGVIVLSSEAVNDPQTLDGFHANLRGELSAEQVKLLPLIAEPANPVRVWA